MDPPYQADQYIAETNMLAAAPCTAMVCVLSYVTDGDPAHTLVQVLVNDFIMLVLFRLIVAFLVSGASFLTVPFHVWLDSVLAVSVIPLIIGVLLRGRLVRRQARRVVRADPVTAFCSGDMLSLLVDLFSRRTPRVHPFPAT